MNKFDLTKMFELVNDEWLLMQKHPSLDLFIFNYSKQTQYARHWNEMTLAARGLVLNSEGILIAKCLPKFFNYQELAEDKIPTGSFKVYDKLDGSYLQVFKYKNEVVVSSRGSFTSDQAIKGKEILFKKYSHLIDKIETGINYIFEIIFPQNRIVVDYGDLEDIIMISTINATTFEDKIIDIGFPIVKQYDGLTDFEEIKALNVDNLEGIILAYVDENGNVIDRIKSKFSEYVRLHRVLTNCSSRDIWNIMKRGESLNEVLERVPDEFYDWVSYHQDTLNKKFKDILEICKKNYKPLHVLKLLQALPNGTSDILLKKEAALYIKRNKYQNVLFAMYNGMSYENIIWEIIEPKWEKPFNLKYEKLEL
jgi:RNA ligase